MGEKKSNHLICNNCNAEVPDGNKFCGECGKPIKTSDEDFHESSHEFINCPNCNSKVGSGLKFCTECGEKIDQTKTPKQQTNCPNCNEDIEPDLKFCTKCGTKISDNPSVKADSSWFDSISKSSQDFKKGMDKFLTNTADSLDKSISKSGGPTKTKKAQFKPVRIKGVDNPNPGYLVCDSCGGVYKLKSCDSVDDFSNDCNCGGKITHLKNLPTPTRPY